MADKHNKVKKYRKPINLNIGMLIFAVIFFYVVFCVIMYFQSTHIVRYEVKEGSIATNNIFRGLILRDEIVVTTDNAGYINYFTYEGERVAKGDLVYTIDETGRLSEQIESSYIDENTLTDKELREFKSEIVNFMHDFEGEHYSGTYEFKNTLQNTLLKLANVKLLESMQSMNANLGIANVINYNSAPRTGIVIFWTDGYEGITPEQVSESLFDEKKYEKKQILNNDLLSVGDAVYKLSTNEKWSIMIPVEPAKGVELEEEEYIKVRFLKNNYESWAETKLLHNGDGKSYIQLTFTNSMITFVNDRFLDIELIIHDEKGLKIPVSSIVEKEFFLIGKDYILEGTSRGKYSVLRQCYLETGDISTEQLNIDVYSYDEASGEYYLDASILNPGDVLLKPDSQETYTVSKRATLIGVYNMNKGYADFKQINILYQNEEYAIVKANTRYGLNVYDYIVLDAKSVRDDQFINE